MTKEERKAKKKKQNEERWARMREERENRLLEERRAISAKILPKKLHIQGCKSLACGIAASAVKDWRAAYARWEKHKKVVNKLLAKGFEENDPSVLAAKDYMNKAEADMERIEVFMRSEWYEKLQAIAYNSLPVDLVAYCRKNPHIPKPTIWDIKRSELDFF